MIVISTKFRMENEIISSQEDQNQTDKRRTTIHPNRNQPTEKKKEDMRGEGRRQREQSWTNEGEREETKLMT